MSSGFQALRNQLPHPARALKVLLRGMFFSALLFTLFHLKPVTTALQQVQQRGTLVLAGTSGPTTFQETADGARGFQYELARLFAEELGVDLVLDDSRADLSRDGFDAVEFLFPYEHAPADIASRLKVHGLTQALFNLPPGNWAAGERGMACHPGREAEFAAALEQALPYIDATGCLRVHAMAGLVPAGGNQLPPVLEGAAPLTAACPSLEGRADAGGGSTAGMRGKDATLFLKRCLTPAPLPDCLYASRVQIVSRC